MQFCHIAPTAHLDLVRGRNVHLTLAHLLETDPEYASFYKNEYQNGSTIIQDNSAFEMYKQGREMYPADRLIDLAQTNGAHYIVMSDYPGQHSSKTIQAAQELAPQFKEQGFGTFFVPQSQYGDLKDYEECFEWAVNSDLVDYIGVSILGVPNAYGVERNNKLQRYVSRAHFMQTHEDMFFYAKHKGKKIHFLGMVDGPNEISLLGDMAQYVDTWDSSSAVWLGLNGRTYDISPTGLIDGKFELEVDFRAVAGPDDVQLAKRNMNYIDKLVSLC